jgi:hypothetical protein
MELIQLVSFCDDAFHVLGNNFAKLQIIYSFLNICFHFYIW